MMYQGEEALGLLLERGCPSRVAAIIEGVSYTWNPPDATRYTVHLFPSPIIPDPTDDRLTDADGLLVVVEQPVKAVFRIRQFADCRPADRPLLHYRYIMEKLGGIDVGIWTANVVTLLLGAYLDRPIELCDHWWRQFNEEIEPA